MSIGTRIKELRKKSGLTQKELGNILGITQQSIGQFENNKTSPRLDTVQKIADALNVTPNEILGNSKDEEVKFVITPKGIAWVSLREVGIDIPEGVFNAFWILFEDKMKSLGYIYEGQQ